MTNLCVILTERRDKIDTFYAKASALFCNNKVLCQAGYDRFIFTFHYRIKVFDIWVAFIYRCGIYLILKS